MLKVLSWDDKSSIMSFLDRKKCGFIQPEVTEAVKKIIERVKNRRGQCGP